MKTVVGDGFPVFIPLNAGSASKANCVGEEWAKLRAFFCSLAAAAFGIIIVVEWAKLRVFFCSLAAAAVDTVVVT